MMNKINNLYIMRLSHKLTIVSCDSLSSIFINCELNHKWFELITIDTLRTIY
ncbi:hypothetical protein Pint_10352 [Pistacia integerrima]|uniref:Uncharacterized protein n=1 Tax=Pistacia integerrima TaxID=434235 RepID=A0ACC0XH79_9ROSI|nr:hypothetical protein Pint_10352 [Pistacia integerrima]